MPTVLQTGKFPMFAEQGRDKFPAYADTMDDLHVRRRATLMAAHEAGVALYVGSDGGGTGRHGYLAEEIVALHEMGLPAAEVVAAASWKGRGWLGFEPLLGEGRPPTSSCSTPTRRRPDDAGPAGVRGAARRGRREPASDGRPQRQRGVGHVLHQRPVALDQLLADGLAGALVDHGAPDLVVPEDLRRRPARRTARRAPPPGTTSRSPARRAARRAGGARRPRCAAGRSCRCRCGTPGRRSCRRSSSRRPTAAPGPCRGTGRRCARCARRP